MLHSIKDRLCDDILTNFIWTVAISIDSNDGLHSLTPLVVLTITSIAREAQVTKVTNSLTLYFLIAVLDVSFVLMCIELIIA